ncbi:PP2C family protein-serine/threonine phosphatase [Janthinobacterium fluminis]|uniref:Serine/threonine-protein phosphatase n=1 Tax=Janthinobacterium fluminis TaxID=2987524 RepID=A0ABT5K797_9BURK|nr:serine/threonine-protein phosphatase [Janthinobacterium fluminis]MDC8760774.1 serine/threonine-protein phosphatase [Janthinobacterium fluminis]
MSAYTIAAGTAQHIGGRPSQNDRAALYAGARAPGHMLAVLADGIRGGAVAAEQVLHTSKQLFDDFAAVDAASPQRLAGLLHAIVHEAHTVVSMNPLAAGAQCTLALLLLTPHGQAVWAHVGDARVYRFAGAACAFRSNDAAYVEHLVRDDGLAPEAARRHRSSALLGNALGKDFKEPFVTIGSHAGLGAGDAFMLCSDGLWQYFSDAELAAVVAKERPRQAGERLIGKALERAKGKGDNCTMAIVKLVARAHA